MSTPEALFGAVLAAVQRVKVARQAVIEQRAGLRLAETELAAAELALESARADADVEIEIAVGKRQRPEPPPREEPAPEPMPVPVPMEDLPVEPVGERGTP